ncbi:MAG: hypothetical protein AAGG08_03625 [Actinomycetota bacterium]
MSIAALNHVRAALRAEPAEVTALDRLVAMLLADSANKQTGRAYVGAWLVLEAGCSERSLAATLRRLDASGVVRAVTNRPPAPPIVHFPTATPPSAAGVVEDAVGLDAHLGYSDPASETPDPCDAYPQPALHSASGGDPVVHNSRSTARGSRSTARDSRSTARDSRSTARDSRSTARNTEAIPELFPPLLPASTSAPSELHRLASLAARLEAKALQRDGVPIRSMDGFVRSIERRLLSEETDRLERALSIDAPDHARAEWVTGRRRQLGATG